MHDSIVDKMTTKVVSQDSVFEVGCHLKSLSAKISDASQC